MKQWRGTDGDGNTEPNEWDGARRYCGMDGGQVVPSTGDTQILRTTFLTIPA